MDRTQVVILAIFVVLVAVPYLLCTLAARSQVRRRRRAWERRWREQLAAPTEELEELILGCDILDMTASQGRLRDDPEVARFLDLVRSHEPLAARDHVGGSVEAFLVAAEYRIGGHGRPVAMDHGYLDEVLAELVRRSRAAGTPCR